MIEIAIIDDHPMFLSGLEAVLGGVKNIHVTQTFANGRTALDELKVHETDIVLMDINLPDIMGIRLAQALRMRNQFLGIIFVSMFSRQQTFGGKTLDQFTDFVSKDQDPDILIQSIQALYANISKAQNSSRPTSLSEELTTREEEILTLYRQYGSVTKIAATLGVKKNTIATHLKNIRDKMSLISNDTLRS